jgi:hypothetical protein
MVVKLILIQLLLANILYLALKNLKEKTLRSYLACRVININFIFFYLKYYTTNPNKIYCNQLFTT